jgi:hypothetical protein
MKQLENKYTNLRDGTRCMVSMYIQTPKQTVDFPFTDEGLTLAAQMYSKYVKEIRSDDEDYTCSLFMDDGISHIEYISIKQLGHSAYYKWMQFRMGKYHQSNNI